MGIQDTIFDVEAALEEAAAASPAAKQALADFGELVTYIGHLEKQHELMTEALIAVAKGEEARERIKTAFG